MDICGMPGGSLDAAVGTTAVAIDLRAFIGLKVMIWSDDEDVLFSFAADDSDTTLISAGDQAASTSALVADRAAVGFKVPRVVLKAYPWLIAAHATGTGTIRVKPVAPAFRSDT
jgi:hypothetical protein